VVFLDREIIRIENLTKIFRSRNKEVVALKDLNLSVKEGEFLVIVGPSGCGKSTLLRILAGLEKKTYGEIYIKSKLENRPITAVVFQGDAVFPWMKVIENVEYSLKLRGVPFEERKKIAQFYLKLMGMENFADYYPHQLSGGMKQRVNVARAFASDPEILLMDEPFGALDEQNRLILQQELLKIWEGSGKTAIFITHSIDEAIFLGDRIVVMTAQPGRVKAAFDVGFERPREMLSLKSTPQFIELYRKVWQVLKEEVLKSRK
jgi:NitT/TauT family transport system ATP-binding protein